MSYWDKFGHQMLSTVAFVVIGLAFFAVAFWIITSLWKMPVKKEIEEDQNSALAILIGSIIIGISIIIAAAIHGGT
jgi:putative membrane protein